MYKNNKHCVNKENFSQWFFRAFISVLFVVLITACGQEAEVVTEAGSSKKASNGTTLYLKIVDSENKLLRNVDKNTTVGVIATLRDVDGVAIAGEVIEFTTDLGTLDASNGLTGSDGREEIKLSVGSIAKAGLVTATVKVEGNDISVNFGFIIDGTTSVTENPGTNLGTNPDNGNTSQSNNGALDFISTSASRIALKSTGGAGLSEFAVVTFKLVGADGLPISDQTVNFSLNNRIGGMSVEPVSAVTTVDGTVSTVVQSGTVPTVVRVQAKATLVDGAITNEILSFSDKLAIGSGIPDQNSMSLSFSSLAPEAQLYDGEEVDVTIILGDHFNNFVPDGTTVYFTTEGGVIEPSCETVGSRCSVKWLSSDPRPTDHRVTVLAMTLGNESFKDTNSDGVYSLADGEPFADVNSNGIYDEPFTDTNGNRNFDEPFLRISGIYELGDFFIDYNANGVFDGDPNNPAGETEFVDSNGGNGQYDGSGRIPLGELAGIIDKNANGLFDGSGFADLAEPYLDANENHKRDVDEIFFDTDLNGVFTEKGDGLFNGVYCKADDPICSVNKTLRIRKSGTFVMAGSFAKIAITDATSNLIYWSSIPGITATTPNPDGVLPAGTGSFIVYFQDSAGQVMPEGTTVSVTSTVGELFGAPNGVLPNNRIKPIFNRGPEISESELMQNGLNSFGFSIGDSDTTKVESGAIVIEFTTPKENSTSFALGVSI